jgi:hypothetical protein
LDFFEAASVVAEWWELRTPESAVFGVGGNAAQGAGADAAEG